MMSINLKINQEQRVRLPQFYLRIRVRPAYICRDYATNL